MFKTSFETCHLCDRFDECRKLNKLWICFDCVPSIKDNSDRTIKNLVLIYKKPKKNNIIPEYKEQKKKKRRKTSCKYKQDKNYTSKLAKKLLEIFQQNPDKDFTTQDMFNLVKKYKMRSVQTTLSQLYKRGKIFSKRAYKDNIHYKFYSFTEPNKDKLNKLEIVEKLLDKHKVLSIYKISELTYTNKFATYTYFRKHLEVPRTKYKNITYYYSESHFKDRTHLMEAIARDYETVTINYRRQKKALQF